MGDCAEDVEAGGCVRKSAMIRHDFDTEVFDDRLKSVVGCVGVERLGQLHGAQRRDSSTKRFEHRYVVSRVVRDDEHVLVPELLGMERRQEIHECGLPADHLWGDSVGALGSGFDWYPRIDEGVHLGHLAQVCVEFDPCDLDGSVTRFESGGFEVEDDHSVELHWRLSGRVRMGYLSIILPEGCPPRIP